MIASRFTVFVMKIRIRVKLCYAINIVCKLLLFHANVATLSTVLRMTQLSSGNMQSLGSGVVGGIRGYTTYIYLLVF